MLGTELSLSSRGRMTLGVGTISGLFLTQCHANLRDWRYIFIAGQGSQVYVEMLV
jgi:hypothetical protein